MKIDYLIYQLVPESGGASREGALLRVQFAKNLYGYSDLHPWTVFEDLPITEQLEKLKAGNPTSLARQSLWLAERDAKARSAGRALVDPQTQLKNNFLILDLSQFSLTNLDLIKKMGFTVLKLKVGNDKDMELFYMKKIADTQNFLMRLDYNIKGSFESLLDLQSSLSKSQFSLIQYVEDPFSYDESLWNEAQKITKIALDFESEKISWDPQKRPSCHVMIVKPVRRPFEMTLSCLKTWKMPFAVTSALDHPVGAIHAYSLAQEMAKALPVQALDPGCLTLNVYKSDAFGAQVSLQGPYIQKVNGLGIGFDNLLQKQEWKPLT